MKSDCESPEVHHSDHQSHAPEEVCWTVVRMYIAAFRRGIHAKYICHEWGYIWTA